MHIPLHLEALMTDGRPDGGGKSGTSSLNSKHVMDGEPVDEDEAKQWRETGSPGARSATQAFVESCWFVFSSVTPPLSGQVAGRLDQRPLMICFTR